MLPKTIACTLTAVPHSVGNVVFAAINDRAVVHPRAEHGADGAAQLVPRIVRKILAGALLDQRLEALDEFLLIVGGQLGVLDVLVISLVLELVDDLSNGS